MAAGTKVQLRLGDRIVAEIAFHNGEFRIGEHVLTISVGDGEDAQASRTGESDAWATARACFAPDLPELAPRSRAASTADGGEIPFAAGEDPLAAVAEERAASAARQASRTGESDVWETARACFAPDLPELAPRSGAASTADSGEIPFAAGEDPLAAIAAERAASAARQASRTGESDVWETARACFAPELPERAPRSRAVSAADSREIPFAAGEGPVAEVADARAAGAAPVGAAPQAGRRPAISLHLPDPEGRFAIEEDLVGGQRLDAASILPRFSETARARVRGQEPPAQAAELADPLYAGLIVARAGKVDRVVSFHGAELVVGSGPTCDLVLPTAGISRHHALFVREAGGVRVLDLDSAHGLRVNGERATEHVLQFGDVVAIDDYALALVPVLDREPLDHAVRSGAAASSVGNAGQPTARPSAPLVSMPERDLVTESDDEDLWDFEKELEIVSAQATTTAGSPSGSAGTGLAVEVVLGDEDLPPALRPALHELGSHTLHLPAELRIRRRS